MKEPSERTKLEMQRGAQRAAKSGFEEWLYKHPKISIEFNYSLHLVAINVPPKNKDGAVVKLLDSMDEFPSETLRTKVTLLLG